MFEFVLDWFDTFDLGVVTRFVCLVVFVCFCLCWFLVCGCWFVGGFVTDWLWVVV